MSELNRKFKYIEARKEVLIFIFENQKPGKRSFNLSDIKCRIDSEGIKHCKWCDNPIIGKTNRQYCSSDCYSSAFFYCRPHAHFSKMFILERQNNRCAQCNISLSTNGSNWELDHIVSVYHGGRMFDPTNRQGLCKKCHKLKTKNERVSI
jgi:hypothetical protein